MSPESKMLFQSIRERDKSLTEQERALVEAMLSGISAAGFVSPESQPDNLMKLTAVATRFDVSEATIRRLEENDELVPIYITPDLTRYDPKEVEAFLARRRAIRDQVRDRDCKQRRSKNVQDVSLRHGT